MTRSGGRPGGGSHADDPAALLVATGVHAWYGSSHVLHGIDLTIRRGEALGLLGRNGMGKSTLIRTLLGHVSQRSGQVLVAGIDVSGARAHQVARLGVAYVPEGRGIFGALSVRENLVMAARPGLTGRAAWTLTRVLDLFPRLGERLGHLGGLLSGGEQQMLSIGRALLTNPELIILDEATEGLAPKIVAEIWRVVASIRDDGIAILIVDRNYRKLAANVDRLVVLQKGSVVLHGDAARLLASSELGALLGV